MCVIGKNSSAPFAEAPLRRLRATCAKRNVALPPATSRRATCAERNVAPPTPPYHPFPPIFLCCPLVAKTQNMENRLLRLEITLPEALALHRSCYN